MFLHLIFLVGVAISTCLAEFEPAYLKICGKKHKHVVESTICQKGVWLKEGIEPGCVCVRGVWALTNGFCDDKAAIIVGDGHCFHVSFEIRSAKLIGDPKDPFSPKVYLATRTLDAFYEIKEDGHTPSIASDGSMIIGVNPRQVAQRQDFGSCIDLDPEGYKEPVHIHVNPRRSPTEWVLNKKKTFSCAALTQYEHHVAFGEMFIKDKVEPRIQVERQCIEDCPKEGDDEPDKRKPMGRSMGLLSGDDEDSPAPPPPSGREPFKGRSVTTFKNEPPPPLVYGSSPVYADVIDRSNSPPMKTIEERNREKEELRARVTQDKEQYERETNEQTLRMMHAHISPLLLNISMAQITTREYQYFQTIRQVAEKACPQDFVPKLLLKGLMRMFRQLLWETLDTFPHSQGNDDVQFKRTLGVLQLCANLTVEPSILYATYTDAWKNETDARTKKGPGPAPGPERCPTPLIYAINGTDYNITNIAKENYYVRNISEFMPHLKFNSSQVDFVIEAAWKIALIAHHKCTKYVNYTQAADFSHFFSQIQSFFNHRILKRWTYEKSVQATFDIIQMVFPNYDLKKFMFGLDACFFGTQMFGWYDYNNVWLQRPKYPGSFNDLSQERFILPGATSHLSTLDYAPDIRPKVPIPVPPANSTKRRVTRSAWTYYMWEDNARCLDNYMEPARRHDLGYHLPPGCTLPLPL